MTQNESLMEICPKIRILLKMTENQILWKFDHKSKFHEKLTPKFKFYEILTRKQNFMEKFNPKSKFHEKLSRYQNLIEIDPKSEFHDKLI